MGSVLSAARLQKTQLAGIGVVEPNISSVTRRQECGHCRQTPIMFIVDMWICWQYLEFYERTIPPPPHKHYFLRNQERGVLGGFCRIQCHAQENANCPWIFDPAVHKSLKRSFSPGDVLPNFDKRFSGSTAQTAFPRKFDLFLLFQKLGTWGGLVLRLQSPYTGVSTPPGPESPKSPKKVFPGLPARSVNNQEKKISPKRKFWAGYPCGHPAKNFGQALQILEKSAFRHGHPARTSTKKLRSEKLRADFSFPK